MRTASEILDEIRTLKEIDSDTALGALFGTRQSTVASWRSRNSIPYPEIIAFCVKEGISLDWLLTGVEPDTPPQVAEAKPDRFTEKILLMLGDMTDEQKEKVRVYAEDQKRLNDCLVELAGKGDKKRRGAA